MISNQTISKTGKTINHNFSKYSSLPIVFQRDINKGNLSFEHADEEQSHNAELFLSVREKILIS